MSEGIVNHTHTLYQSFGLFLFSLEHFLKKTRSVFPVILLFLNITEWETFKLIFPQHHDHIFIFNTIITMSVSHLHH